MFLNYVIPKMLDKNDNTLNTLLYDVMRGVEFSVWFYGCVVVVAAAILKLC